MSFINKLEDFATSALHHFKPFDPTTLNDELALKTEWQAMKRGGANFSTHKLKETTNRKLEYKPTLMAYIFPSIFISVFSIGGYVAATNFADKFGSIAYLVGGLFIVMPVGIGIYIMRTYVRSRVFDTNIGMYYRGKLPLNYSNVEPSKNSCRIDDIHAIQLLKYISTSSSEGTNQRRTYYELNLVLESTYRIHVATVSDMYKVRKEAEKIASTIDVPIWDGL